jgi:hypothetical protein
MKTIVINQRIRAASKLKADLKVSEVEASFVDVPDMQEDQILHDAAKETLWKQGTTFV